MSRGTPRRAIRIPDQLWERFGQAVEHMETDRNSIIRTLIAWYVRDAGVALPPRPPAK